MRALLIELHPWRGISLGRDLFYWALILGFVTLVISRHRITDRLHALLADLRRLREKDHA